MSLTRHTVAHVLASVRQDAASGADAGPQIAAALDLVAGDIAHFLPPGQRDQFLIAAGVPR